MNLVNMNLTENYNQMKREILEKQTILVGKRCAFCRNSKCFRYFFHLWSTSVLIQFPQHCRQSSKEANFSKSLDWFHQESVYCLLLASMESDLCQPQTCSNFIALTWRLLWVRKMEKNHRPFKIKDKSKFLDVYYRLNINFLQT